MRCIGAGMYSAEVLSQLRSLNHLNREIRSLPRENPEAILLQTQIEALRARLPNSILEYHDRFAARSQPSAVKVAGDSCSACHLKLPRDLCDELAAPGRFGVCPNCGVFLWLGEKPIVTTDRKPARRSKSKTER